MAIVERGLSEAEIRLHAEWYIDQSYRLRVDPIEPFDQSELDHLLRLRLETAGVYPEFIRTEFERVMVEVFKPCLE